MTQAMVLGESLHKHNPNIPRVLIVGEEILNCPMIIALGCRWEVRAVKDIEFSEKAKEFLFGSCHERISWRVWIKLRAWEIEDFEKVCFMDRDMLVKQSMDPVFASRSLLAGVFRGSRDLFRPWEDRPTRTYYIVLRHGQVPLWHQYASMAASSFSGRTQLKPAT